MAVHFIKKSLKVPTSTDVETEEIVKAMLKKIEQEGDSAALEYSKKLDNWDGNVLVSEEEIEKISATVPQTVKDDIAFAHENVTRFAEKQLESMLDFDVQLQDGLYTGQTIRPVQSAGCYVPGGRYAHIASAIMTIATAKVAGVKNITACSPPKPGQGVNPHILYAMNYCGANNILAMGGVQAIAAMTYGLFGLKPADILAGPGNRFVAEAKRLLFGKVGIDVFAGPTEIAIIADDTADSDIVAIDLVGQAEHGLDSPAWLITDSKKLADEVVQKVPEYIAKLPEDARLAANHSWENYGEVQLCETRDEMVTVSDDYAAEHLQVHARDLDWWLKNLNNYGSLFLGEETTVAFGDKCSGTNHVLPTKEVARYTGGLSVAKFVKVLTWQRMDKEALPSIAACCARISRLEGMEAHARTADARLSKYFPDRVFQLQV